MLLYLGYDSTTTFPSDDSGIASTGPTATISREFVLVRFADAVDANNLWLRVSPDDCSSLVHPFEVIEVATVEVLLNSIESINLRTVHNT